MAEINQCLLCGRLMPTRLSLKTILGLGPIITPALCAECQETFQRISGSDRCRGCGRDGFTNHLCPECHSWQRQYGWLVENHPLYRYHGAIADYLVRYKFNGDYRLFRVFSAEVQRAVAKLCQQSHASLVVPIPVSQHTALTRGFNQVSAWLDHSCNEGGPVKELLATREWQKQPQSKKNREGRLASPQPFHLVPHTHLTGQTVLLVDDVYTTGRTLYHAASLLKAAGAARIVSVTLAA